MQRPASPDVAFKAPESLQIDHMVDAQLGKTVELGQVAHVVRHQPLGARQNGLASSSFYQFGYAVVHERLEHHQGVPHEADAGPSRGAAGPFVDTRG